MRMKAGKRADWEVIRTAGRKLEASGIRAWERLRSRLEVNTNALSADEGVVFRVGSDPEPEHSVGRLDTDRAVMQAHTNRPEPTHLLEVKRRMSRIAFKQGEHSVGEVSHGYGQSTVALPEGWGSAVDQSSLERPAA